MKKYSSIKNNSIKSMALALCLALLSGCAGSIFEPGKTVPSEQSCDSANSYCSEDANEFVNYTEVAADYREYGERTPRDQNIVHAGAGSNMSASIPPSIEGEVLDYEDQINMNEGSNNQFGNSDYGTADDPVEDWLAEEGSTLKKTITEWSDAAGWRVVWNTNRNYNITAGAMFRGRFADVSSALVRAFARARPAPIATFYKGNRVLVIETMEDENAYD